VSTNNGYEIRMSFYTNYLLEQNLIVKKSMPIAGIVCSNPRRAERIVSSHLTDANLLKEYHSAWQLDIYIGHYQGKMMFVAAIPVGAAGAAFAIQQFAVAGARYIVRYGSNDDPRLTDKRMDEVIIVDRADNLYGLMQGSGAPPETWGKILHASPILINSLSQKAQELQIEIQLAVCHHIEDYGAYAFPAFAGKYGENIMKCISELEASDSSRLHSRDMETAALFYRALLDNFHAATVLQNVPKFSGFHQTYDNKQGEIAKKIEKKFSDLIFSALATYIN